MPIEIRELIVKITVDEAQSKKGLSEEELMELKKALVKECVDKVLVKLENQVQR
jgi:predicted metal-binding transcription factor (methanogenesis marker protein 9)